MENGSPSLEKIVEDKNLWRPLMFRPGTSESDRAQLEALRLSGRVWREHDELRGQLTELIKSLFPEKTFTAAAMDEAIAAHLGAVAPADYGVWVYYPWSGRLVHLLDEEEFIESRTNRNRNKITREEQAALQGKRVGVIGLSVGSSVSVTMAMERSVGELRIADFDILEITNMNRIRTGVHNLGVSKVVAVAREIAEIDPFFKVICFHEGITEGNLDRFILDGGKLDVLIDECDGLDIKIACRERAKFHRVPVLMEASERGTVDVERFDLEPDRPILHGLLHDVDPAAAKAAKTNEEKMPYMMKIVGIDTLSDRMKSSLLEITQTVTTWPQLASAVTYGGGMTADICRRMMLGQYTESGRYVVDIADLVADGSPKLQIDPFATALTNTLPAASERDFSDVIGPKQPLPAGFFAPDRETVTTLVQAAIQAPSGGNNQPWRWIYRAGTLYLVHEVDASVAYLDYRHRGAYISLAAALENLELEAHVRGLEAVTEIRPEEDSLLVATIRFRPEPNALNQTRCLTYHPWMFKRATNRRITTRSAVSPERFRALEIAASETPGARLILRHSEDDMARIARIVGKADRVLLTCRQSHEEFYNEIKWTPEAAEAARTGIDIRTIDLTNTELAGFQLARHFRVVENLLKWGGGGAFEKLGKKSVERSAAVGLLTMPDYSRASFLSGGRAMQRVWIEAARQGLAIQPLSAAIFLFARLVKGHGEGLSDRMKADLSDIRPLHREVFGITDEPGEIFLFRIHEAAEMFPSMRKPVSDVLEFAE
jgi:molybdopterin/thiamine biosynthesis adenylyltransferase